MSQTLSLSFARRYGLARVARVWNVSRAGVYRARVEAPPYAVNGVAERFIRTLKENLLWVRVFNTVEELRQALREFVHHYNENWLVARHGYQTPTQVRAAPAPSAISDLHRQAAVAAHNPSGKRFTGE